MQHRLLALALAAALALAGCSSSQPAADNASASTGQAPPSSSDGGDEAKSDFDKAVAESEKIDGLFTVYRDTTDGSLHLALREDQLGAEFIYFTFARDGVAPAGAIRGQYREETIFTVREYYDRLEFVEQNTSFYFDDDSALSRAAEANVSPSVLHVEKVVARDTTDNLILVKADDLFLTEALHQVKPPRYPGQSPFAFQLGRQDKQKTKVASIRNYPENTDVVVDYVFSNPYPLNGGGAEVTDARNVTISLQHSLVQAPDNDYEPRFADPRVGYFTNQMDDQTSASATPYHDLLQRWHLVKQDPDADLSEPVEPITWWIENTTPERLRPIIREAALGWNEAFEAAGFKNAVEVKVQPDDADWDAGDIRYNVLRWTSSPSPRFGGYGPSFVDPRTGQILGADIMLEYVFLTNRVRYNQLFEAAGMPLMTGMPLMMSENPLLTTSEGPLRSKGPLRSEELLPPEMAQALGQLPPEACTLGAFMHANMLFGRHALRATRDGASGLEGELTRLMEEGVTALILHELGHTMGLSHNMKATQLHPPEDLHDMELTRAEGLTGSVMDYTPINVAAPDQDTQGQYYDDRVGPYDVWAIRYGYADDGEVEAIIAASTEPEHAFGNDADDMRYAGLSGIDPRVMVGDLSSDALAYAEGRMALVGALLDDLVTKYREPGQSYQELRDAYLILTGQHAQAATVVSRYVGGVYVERGFIGQEGAETPYTPVAAADQQRAVQILADDLFAPDAFAASEELYRHLQPQRRGFGFFFNTEDPKIHARALAVQTYVLAHLLHPNVLERITDTRLYGNAYPLADYMDDLTDAVFAADARTNVNTFRQNLQLAYVTALTGVVGEDGDRAYDYVAQSAALRSLRQIQRTLRGKGGNAETRAHTDHVRFLIDKALATD